MHRRRFDRVNLLAWLLSGVAFWPACNPLARDGSVDKNVWSSVSSAGRFWPRNGYDAVGDGRHADVFRSGFAILRVPKGVDPDRHAREAGLTPVSRLGAVSSARVMTKDKRLQSLLAKRARRLPTEPTSRVMLVRLPLETARPGALTEYLARKPSPPKQVRVSSDAGLRTLAVIAQHQLAWEAKGFSLTLDVGREPFALVQSTNEGASGDALADAYAAITNLRRAWMLAQIARTPFADPTQGFSDGKTVTGPAILGIVDDGFDTSVADFAPDILFPTDASIGGAGMGNFHGHGVTSIAMSPIDNGVPGAGTCLYSAGSTPPLMSPTARVALLWANAPEPDMWSGADGVVGAVGGGADVVNMSWGSDCGWWCRNFGDLSGWSALSLSLQIGRDAGVAMIAAAGNAGADLEDRYIIPCEMADGRPVCVGAIDRSENNVGNFGKTVHIWAPGAGLIASPRSGATTATFGGTSAAAPFISGLAAMATSMHGSALSTSSLRDALMETSRPSMSDDKAPRIVDAYRFLRRFANVSLDAREPNPSGSFGFSTPPVAVDENLTISEPLYYAPDEDYLAIADVPNCSSIAISVRYLDDPAGTLDAHYLYGAELRTVSHPAADRLLVEGVRISSMPSSPGSGKTFLGLRTTGGLTTGYWIESIVVTPPPLNGEGPSIPASCNGIDDDCDGNVDEGFLDTDHDGIADCVDPDDDNDCVADDTDNCALTRNFDPYCATGGPTISDCNSRCPYLKPVTSPIGPILECIGESTLPPECWTDGCWNPEPFNDPLVLRALARIQPGGPNLFDFPAPGKVRFSERVPRSGAIGARAGAGGNHHSIGFHCRRLHTAVLRTLEDVAAKCAEWAATRDCQRDTDGNGVGDACQGPTP